MLLLLALLTGPASAADTTEQPLAIPADPTAPAAPQAQARPERASPPSMSPQKLDALRRYKAERLSIHGETEVHQGTTTVWTGGYWGPRWGPRHAVAVGYGPVFTSRSWGIYQGPQRLAVPEALKLAGDPRGDQLQQTIDSKRRTARTWYTVAGVGGGAIVASLFGQLAADSRQEHVNWQLVGLGGAGTAVVGMLAGSSPSAEARLLESVPARTLSPTEARAVLDRHNDRLRQELGLSPQDVWSIEQGPPGPP